MTSLGWNLVRTQEDADSLMKVFGCFHDSCLRELHLSTEHWVDTDLSMSASPDLHVRVRILLQRQATNPSAIEMVFEEVTRLGVSATPNYRIIFEASLLLAGSDVYWADALDWHPDRTDRDNATWISARKLRWRDASDWMGPQRRFDGSSLSSGQG